MKLSDPTPDAAPASCAELVMETAALLMRTIRREMRRQSAGELSLPQYRALRRLERHAQSTLTHLAAHLDLTLASASKLIDILEKHGLVTREPCATDRRQVALVLTDAGHALLQSVEAATHARLAALLSALPEDDLAAVQQGMRALHALFTHDMRGEG